MSADAAIRLAKPEDESLVAEIAYGRPSPEAIGLAGTPERARELGLVLYRSGVLATPQDTALLAWVEDRAAGVLIGRPAVGDFRLRWGALPDLFGTTLGLFGPIELAKLLYRALVRWRLNIPPPADALHISELRVEPDFRGRGIGGALLEAAEGLARENGCARLSLTSVSNNPARRLFERQGFTVTRARSVMGYEKWTSSPARVLMEKPLS